MRSFLLQTLAAMFGLSTLQIDIRHQLYEQHICHYKAKKGMFNHTINMLFLVILKIFYNFILSYSCVHT